MASQSNIARPYAQALFELAQQSNELSQWQDQINLLAMVCSNSELVRLADNPYFSHAQLEKTILDICDNKLTKQAHNLLKLLIKNDRLSVVQDIATAYSDRKATAEKVIDAKLVTACAIDEDYKNKFTQALQVKLGRTINPVFSVDETLLGGMVISAGDWVIDGSVKTELDQLVNAL